MFVTSGMASIDQSKLRVCGKRRSQALAGGRYKKVSVLVRRWGESAAGLSELENCGGLQPIQYSRTANRTAPQPASQARLTSRVVFFLWKIWKWKYEYQLLSQKCFHSIKSMLCLYSHSHCSDYITNEKNNRPFHSLLSSSSFDIYKFKWEWQILLQ